ncbi:HpcH/HpaI aldolase/citrate lyase family protein [Paraburkholderia phenazinium]|jgi:citrate lyase subunit beta/citryl-CoA lyase|uniref:Citrate lyase subunit beta / citryl-CoA lyase n=1 Tax=Paraburkholderia phenazinium TaxID=60549 RepID=A0A1G8GTN4_9BURK|nr:CoA ester lyase [Paraburkholderia phenazinium]SDH97641.1 citrate lyase subunit beta / citryl-CoA lyase [Paraburkholderia phenazinium]
MSTALPRSYLFVPGNRPERFEKARASGADAVILDLEDAVQPEEKPAARDAVLAAADAARPAWVRINGSDTPWFSDDIAALVGHPGIAGVVLPKAETQEQVSAVLAHAHAAVGVLPIVETARGFANLTALCTASRVGRIVFGTLDFQIDLGIDGDGEELHLFRSQIVLASRLAGIGAPVDGVSTTIDDAAAIEADARRGRRFGFGGKLCIHPKQLEAVHRAYAWSEAEKTWAARVLQAVEASKGAAVAVDGKMVDLPVILKAQRILGRG